MDYVFSLLGIDGVGCAGPLKRPNADYQPAFAFHTIDSNAGYDEAAAGPVARSAEDYLAHLDTYYQ